jgi:hypothetical protein
MCTGSTYYYYYYILSDYIKVSVDGSKLSYPKNPSMKLGNRGSPTWILSNEPVFNYVYTVEDVTLINDIQSLVKPQSSQYVEIKIKLASDTPGVIRITNFKVSYTSPPWCKPIPAYHMPEDTPTKSLIDLSFYWTDDATSAKKLVYNITWQQDTRKLIANISSDPDTWHLDFKIPSMGKNWFGTVGFRVGAADGDGLFRESPTFFVTIDQVNDPPVITPIARQVATEGVPFNLTVVVKDVDRDGDSKDPNFPKDPTEEIIYGDNSSLFNIDPLTGEIFFTPSQEQVGVYDIQITATDREGESDQKNFTLEVRDAEDPPILDPIPEQTGMQDTEFSYSATAYDPDVPYGDELAFSDDSPMFEINASTGLIDFTPTVDDIGIHTVTITVTDRAGQNASQEFMFSIYNSIGSTDRPPSIQPIANQTAREGELFELWANASDPDIAELGDAITFADNCPIFDINKRTGKVSFTPGARDAGTYKVKITVKDGDGLTATAEFWLTVIKTNHPPVVTSILPRDGANVVQDKRFALSAEATDADGDLLNYTWRDGDTVLGYGSSVSVVFRDKGTYIITLTVSDGKSQQTNETTLEVIENTGGGGGGGLPGFEAVVVAASVAAVAAVLAGRRRR